MSAQDAKCGSESASLIVTAWPGVSLANRTMTVPAVEPFRTIPDTRARRFAAEVSTPAVRLAVSYEVAVFCWSELVVTPYWMRSATTSSLVIELLVLAELCCTVTTRVCTAVESMAAVP